MTPSTTAPTPQSSTSALPPQTKTPTPAPVAGSASVQSNGTPINATGSPAHPPAPSSQPESVNGSIRPANGTPTGSDTARDRQQAKKQQRREKEKERKKEERERERADKDGGTGEGVQQHQPKHSTSSAAPSQDADTATPLSPSDGPTGSRTPTGGPRKRNPWTLFMKLPGPCTENDIREFFQSAKEGVCWRSTLSFASLTPPADYFRQIPSQPVRSCSGRIHRVR